jgi:hypothetical protein
MYIPEALLILVYRCLLLVVTDITRVFRFTLNSICCVSRVLEFLLLHPKELATRALGLHLQTFNDKPFVGGGMVIPMESVYKKML